jgi:hypothetical protein
MCVQENRYDIHGIELRVTSDHPAIAAAVQMLLGHFQRECVADTALDVVFHGVQEPGDIPLSVSPGAPVLFAHRGQTAGEHPRSGPMLRGEWWCTIYRDQGRTVADFHEQGLLIIDGQREQVEGYLVQPDAMHLDVRISFLHFALTELLKRQGLYTLHAASLERGGRGLLIPGSSGRGKTTSCIALLRSGYRCLSDDHPLLRANGKGLEVLSFPVKIDVTEASIGFFPELQQADGKLHQGVRKRYFAIEDLYPGATADACEPAVILFPQVVDCAKSRLEPMPKSRALEEIMRQGLLVFDREIASRQFQMFSRLVGETACYRLFFGEDVLDLPQLIDPLLDQG